MKIFEVNPDTLKGSVGPGLTASKFWAFTQLSKIKNNFDVIYILGSWYGNASLLLSMDPRFTFDKIINVELNKSMLKTSDRLSKLLGDDKITPMLKDANKLDYRQLTDDSLVINFSCTNIKGNDWFTNIPKGTMVLLSGRNNDPAAVNKYTDLDDFRLQYPLNDTLLLEQQQFQDPETEYDLYLVIGIK